MSRRSYIAVDEELIEKLDDAGVKNGKIIMLYGKILSLSQNKKGSCCAGNAYFAKILKTDVRNIQKYIKTLKDIGFIKVFEERSTEDYAFTVARYIYPQWRVINDELVDIRTMVQEDTNDSSYTHEDMDAGTRTKRYQGTNKKVSGHELLGLSARTDGHPNKRENKENRNRIEENAIASEEVADAPGVAFAPDMVAEAPVYSADAARLRLPVASEWPAEWIEKDIRKLDLRFDGRISDDEMPGIIARTYRQHVNDDELDNEEIFIEMVKEFTGGTYNCNKDEVKKVCAYICGVPENTFVPRVDPDPDDFSSDIDTVDSGLDSPDLADSGLTDPSSDMVSTDITDSDSVTNPTSDSSADPGPSDITVSTDITASSDTKDSDTIVPINQDNTDISGSNPGDAA